MIRFDSNSMPVARSSDVDGSWARVADARLVALDDAIATLTKARALVANNEPIPATLRRVAALLEDAA